MSLVYSPGEIANECLENYTRKIDIVRAEIKKLTEKAAKELKRNLHIIINNQSITIRVEITKGVWMEL